jgi:hypothetical protein
MSTVDFGDLTLEERLSAAAAMERQAARLRGHAAQPQAQPQARSEPQPPASALSYQAQPATPSQSSAAFSARPVQVVLDDAGYLAALERTADAQAAEIARLQAEKAVMDPYQAARAWGLQENRREQGQAPGEVVRPTTQQRVLFGAEAEQARELRKVYDDAAEWARKANARGR